MTKSKRAPRPPKGASTQPDDGLPAAVVADLDALACAVVATAGRLVKVRDLRARALEAIGLLRDEIEVMAPWADGATGGAAVAAVAAVAAGLGVIDGLPLDGYTAPQVAVRTSDAVELVLSHADPGPVSTFIGRFVDASALAALIDYAGSPNGAAPRIALRRAYAKSFRRALHGIAADGSAMRVLRHRARRGRESLLDLGRAPAPTPPGRQRR